MTNHIDVTFDLETVATTANAAVMQVAAVAWLRDAENHPVCINSANDPAKDFDYVFNEYVDLRSCVVDGFDFDQDTVRWWMRQSDAAKRAVTAGLPEPVEEVFVRFVHWLEDLKKATEADTMCLWCQGMDFDAAILRNVCAKYDLRLPFKHTSFRDCRTVILEAALVLAQRSINGEDVRANGICLPSQLQKDPSLAYKLFDPMPDKYSIGREAHDAVYDAVRSTWYTFQALKSLA